jgi:hypothetical protein
MDLILHISGELEALLREKAAATGTDLQAYAASVIERCAKAPLTMVEISGPLADEFAKTGMTDDEFGDLLEEAKHEIRAARRAPSSQ